MHAIAVNEYGESPVVTELPRPEIGPGRVLIEVRAAGMNPMDGAIAAGMWRDMMPGTFPLVLGADVAGIVDAVGDGVTRFTPGEEVFGQLLIAPLGSTGTYAEYISVPEDAPLARVPKGLDPAIAAALPTAGGAALDLSESLEPLSGKTLLIVGAGGGVGSFLTQFAASAGAHVIANVLASENDRVRGYGAAETVDHTEAPLFDLVRAAHPAGIDVLVDLANGPEEFARLASLVRAGGFVVTTKYVADTAGLAEKGVTGVNFQLGMSVGLLERLVDVVVAGRLIPPPVVRIGLAAVPGVLSDANNSSAAGKTVITFP